MVMLSTMLVMTAQVTGGCDGDDVFLKQKNNHHLWPYLRICFWAPLRKIPLPPMQGGLDTKKTPHNGGSSR